MLVGVIQMMVLLGSVVVPSMSCRTLFGRFIRMRGRICEMLVAKVSM